jgi:hypothetical protein
MAFGAICFGVFGPFDLAALRGCHTLHVCWFDCGVLEGLTF